jgi:alcohol dehydrogenase (cytochrome c)
MNILIRARRVVFWMTLVVGLAPVLVAAQEIKNYTPVTDSRLVNPEPENYLMYRGNYAGWGYSPLDQITPANAKKLRPVWTMSTGVIEGHQAPPIVNNGVMFVATPQSQVLALNAKTGDLLWIYKRQLPDDLFQLHPTNRGVALFEDKVYVGTNDAHVVALDARTGKVVWDTAVEDYRKGYYVTMAPLVAKGKVMVGTSGGELAVRGWVQALDARTGGKLWRTYTIPEPGQPGSETWSGDAWKTGGGSVWLTGVYDPALNLAYWGVGNAAPWPGSAHPGDNLYTSSTIALDVDTGAMKNHFQFHWNDSWDWDEMDVPLIIDMQTNGRVDKRLVKPARNGYLYMLDRSSEKISFVSAQPYVKQDVFKSVDPKTGRPEYDMSRKPELNQKLTAFCPSLWGGKNWPPAAYNPKTKLLYIPANDNLCGSLTSKASEPMEAGKLSLGVEVKDIVTKVTDGATYIGELQAWDIEKMQKVWSYKHDRHTFGPLLTTAGGLVFQGGTNDRYFRAFDAKTGQLLWQFRTNSGITAVPSSFAVDGVQYVAVVSGWGVDAERMQGALITSGYRGAGYSPDVPIPQGGVIWVFAVGD